MDLDCRDPFRPQKRREIPRATRVLDVESIESSISKSTLIFWNQLPNKSRPGFHRAVPPEPVAAVEDWDWQMEEPELPMPRLPFAPCDPSTSRKTTVATEEGPHEGPGSPSVSTDVGDELRIPAQVGCVGVEQWEPVHMRNDGVRWGMMHLLLMPRHPIV